ncbi:hypothetical protein [Epilithonimonas zeae]|uniref:hypothetical protein n=1 Tax=Epilithonimonas zeae TaxID=1416779 RepID=UPI00200F5178|nr:hypothetical protein [Epilithonimonas zeae]UQB67391.1 hypothetical protein KI430_10095 [Epilithonimonas zeae]
MRFFFVELFGQSPQDFSKAFPKQKFAEPGYPLQSFFAKKDFHYYPYCSFARKKPSE